MISQLIVQLCLSRAKGGLELSALKLAEEFKTAGHESLVICRDNSFIHKTSLKKSLPTFTLNPGSAYFNPLASWRLRKFLKANQVKAIYVHTLKDLWILYPALWGTKNIQVIGVAHMFITNVNKKDFLHRLIYSQLKNLVVMSESQKAGLKNCLPLDDDKYVLIPNGVNTEKFKPPEKTTEPNREKIVGYVGRLDPLKGVFEFVEAAASFKDRPEVKFVMIGDDTWPSRPTHEKLLKQIADLNLNEKVQLLPFTENINEVMRTFDIFVMPSYEESFGLVLIEAMATGLPCISTLAGGPPEILDHGKVGILVEPKSSEALKIAIDDLLKHPEKRKLLGIASRKKAVEVYDSLLIFNKLKNLILQ